MVGAGAAGRGLDAFDVPDDAPDQSEQQVQHTLVAGEHAGPAAHQEEQLQHSGRGQEAGAGWLGRGEGVASRVLASLGS